MTANDIEDIRAWVKAHKAATHQTWGALGGLIGINEKTLSLFAGNNYNAPEDKLARQIMLYRESLPEREATAAEMLPSPAYFETKSSRTFTTSMNWAHAGTMSLITTGSGTSKTMAAQEYRRTNPNVWIATVTPSSKGVLGLQNKVLEAMGQKDPRGSPLAMSRQIMKLMHGSRGMLIIDEVQHLRDEALEEARSWFDETGVGITLMGNEDVSSKLFLGPRRSSFARLGSRIRSRVFFAGPCEEDAAAFLDAWGVDHPKMREFMTRDVLRSAGGLRTGDYTMKTALMLVGNDIEQLTLGHLKRGFASCSASQVFA